ncbi:MAG TPA: DUF922 domain-containing protein [Verrucomicrobiae bacterium]
MADRVSGVLGMDPPAPTGLKDIPSGPLGAGFVDPWPSGTDAPVPMIARIIAQVDDDWHPPAPDTSPSVEITGTTLEDVGDVLQTLDEWGQGGGALRSDAIPSGTSTNLTVKLHGNLLKRLPKWIGYASASAAAKKEWDRMLGKLEAHEQRHMEIAIEHGDALAQDLIGKDIDQIAKMVTARNAQMAKDQKKLDAATDHGKKQGVPYGDVFLDTSIK